MKAIILSPEQAKCLAKNMGQYGKAYTPWDTVLIPSTIDPQYRSSTAAETIEAAAAASSVGLRAIVGVNHAIYTGSPPGKWWDIRTAKQIIARLDTLGKPKDVFVDFEPWATGGEEPHPGYPARAALEDMRRAWCYLTDWLHSHEVTLYCTPACEQDYAIDRVLSGMLPAERMFWLDQTTYYNMVGLDQGKIKKYGKQYMPGVWSRNIGGTVWRQCDDLGIGCFTYHEHRADDSVWALGTPASRIGSVA